MHQRRRTLDFDLERIRKLLSPEHRWVALIGENFWTGGAYQWRVTDTVLWYWNDDSNWSYDNWARGKEASRVYADFTCFFGSAPVLPENRTTKKET